MKTIVVTLDKEHPDGEAILRAGEIIKAGGLVAFPTETVYGLGGDALNPESSRKIYAAKGRPSDNPLIVHICRWEDIYKIADPVPEIAQRLAARFWPGPLTMILNKTALVPKETTGGLDTVAVRFPSDSIAQRFICAAGGFVAAPSANTSGRPSPTLAQYVKEDMDGRIDAILDGGPCSVGVESTIVDLTCTPPRLLRPGGITLEQLRAALGEVAVDPAVTRLMGAGERPRAPGMKYRHYAPKAPVTVVTGEPERSAAYIAAHAGPGDGVICFEEFLPMYAGGARPVMSLGPAGDKGEQARRVFDALRAFDHTAVSAIWAQCPDSGGIGLAVTNRLNKAAGFHIVEA